MSMIKIMLQIQSMQVAGISNKHLRAFMNLFDTDQ